MQIASLSPTQAARRVLLARARKELEAEQDCDLAVRELDKLRTLKRCCKRALTDAAFWNLVSGPAAPVARVTTPARVSRRSSSPQRLARSSVSSSRARARSSSLSPQTASASTDKRLAIEPFSFGFFVRSVYVGVGGTRLSRVHDGESVS